MDRTKLEFADGRQIDVIAIYGSPQLIYGAMRDTLRIEVDSAKTSFNSLKALFENINNLETIYSISISDDSSVEPVRNEIGSGYNMLVSISEEHRRTQKTGAMEAPVDDVIFVVTIAQETYAEHQLRIMSQ